MATLRVLQGPDKGRVYHTPSEPVTIGRTSEHVPLTDHGSSRRHAELRPTDDGWTISDLGSSNGTYVNGQRLVTPVELKDGDQIKIGSTLLVFSGQDQADDFFGVQAFREKIGRDRGALDGSSILSSLDALEDSVILQPPETADAVAAWNIVYKIAEVIGSTDSVPELLQCVVDILFDHMVVDRLVLLTMHPQTHELSTTVVRYRTKERGRQTETITSQTIIDHVLDTKTGVLCANAMTDRRFGGAEMPDSIHNLGPRSILCVPIIAHEEIRGIFHLDCLMSHHTYTHEQLRLAVAIGRLAGLAIENVSLQESRVRTERLAAAGEAVAYLSHYIRNILQGMQGGADVVELGIKKRSFETAESGWGLVRRNLDRILILAMNMLTFSKERQPCIEPAPINGIITDVISLSQARADEKSVMLLTDLEEMPPVPLDPEGIHQVLNNIVLNAIDAAPREGGRINITSRYHREAGRVVVSIGDNGAGIEPEDRARIFDAFHSSKGHGGTGLGLAAAKKIINELSGEIEIESVIGEGTTFHVSLPVNRHEVDHDDTPPEAPKA